MKHFKFLAFMLAVITGVGFFASCSDDDDDKVPIEKELDIIGVWECQEDDGEKFVFYRDGTCHEYDKGNDMGLFLYKYNKTANVLSVSYDNVGDEIGGYDDYTITPVSDKEFILSYEVYDETIKETFIKKDDVTESYSVSGTKNGYEYVDLGLSVKWAVCNVEALKPELIGGYYAFGEPYEKSNYTEKNYSLTGFVEKGQEYSGTKLDIATNIMGEGWRLPTKEEMDELNNCTWNRTKRNGVYGHVVSNNGKSLFLPQGGYRGYISVSGNEELARYGTAGCYWTGSASRNYNDEIYFLFSSEGNNLSSHPLYAGSTYYGYNVRAVCN